MKYRWKFRLDSSLESQRLKDLALEFNLSFEVLKLLISRGIDTKEKINAFIYPLLRYLPPLNSWSALIEGAKFLASEVEKRSSIVIWGDYDVDGICSAAILYSFLKEYRCKAKVYIPHRIKEGYGLNIQGIERLHSLGFGTLITVDCGITNVKEIKRAKELGFKVIVTDHHYPKHHLPEADIIINPKVGKGCPYPNLAGVGVIFLLIAATNKFLGGDGNIKSYLDLVALGTLADVVELSRENRILVKNGLLFLKEAKRPGIFALKEIANLSPTSYIGTYEVCFMLAPRLNSAGRMDDPQLALELLLTQDLNRAREIARDLNSLNLKRQKEENKILKEALDLISSEQDYPAFVLYSSDWHEGIIGIVASKLTEEFYKPVILLTKNKSFIKGSGRSIPEFHLFEGLNECKDLLKNFGGHAQAAGISLPPSNLSLFKKRFVELVKKVFKNKEIKPTLFIDDRLSLKKIDLKLLKDLELLQPFGPGNPKPIFCSFPLKVQKYKQLKEQLLALELREETSKRTIWGKFWRMSGDIPEDIVGSEIMVTFTPKINTFNNLIGIELDVADWKFV